jgi:hypothetical protein
MLSGNIDLGRQAPRMARYIDKTAAPGTLITRHLDCEPKRPNQRPTPPCKDSDQRTAGSLSSQVTITEEGPKCRCPLCFAAMVSKERVADKDAAVSILGPGPSSKSTSSNGLKVLTGSPHSANHRLEWPRCISRSSEGTHSGTTFETK